MTFVIKLGEFPIIFELKVHFYVHFSPLFLRQDEDTTNRLIVIQCHTGHKNGNLIACARYRIYDERVKAINKNKIQHRLGVTHTLFIINLTHQVSSTSSFVGFQGDPWISYHIDDLRPTSGNTCTIQPLQAISTNISELFIGKYINDIWPHLNTVHKQPQQPQIPMVKNEEDPCDVVSRMTTSSPTPESQLEGESEKNNLRSNQESDIQPLYIEQKLTLRGAKSTKLPGDIKVVDSGEQTQEMAFATADRPENSVVLGDSEHLSQVQRTDTDILTTQIPPIDMSSENIHYNSDDDSDFPLAIQILPTDQIMMDKFSASVEIKEDIKKDDVSISEVPKSKRVTINQNLIAQCQRLYGCIQAAISRLEDATKDRSTRTVSHLTKLIPRDPVEHIGN